MAMYIIMYMYMFMYVYPVRNFARFLEDMKTNCYATVALGHDVYFDRMWLEIDRSDTVLDGLSSDRPKKVSVDRPYPAVYVDQR